MKPSSIPSTPGGYRDSYAKKTGLSHRARIQGKHLQNTSNGAQTSTDIQGVIDTNNLETEAIYTVNNDGAFRKELTVHFLTINGEKFCGSITYQVAKHIVFKHCLGFGDFSNFGGARIGFKGAPTVTFKLVLAINVDELYHLQKFDFAPKSLRQGRSHSDIIGCKITGLRQPDHKHRHGEQGVISNGGLDDGTRKIEIQGCEYRIPKETLVDYPSFFGEIVSDIKEILFDDVSDPITPSQGLNHTGNYCIKIKLLNDLPELLLILGKRIKIVYRGIQRLCPNCFGPHAKARCQSRKMTWPEYINKFKAKYLELKKELVDCPNKHWPYQSIHLRQPNSLFKPTKQWPDQMNLTTATTGQTIKITPLKTSLTWTLKHLLGLIQQEKLTPNLQARVIPCPNKRPRAYPNDQPTDYGRSKQS
jgi:hypothetical protein